MKRTLFTLLLPMAIFLAGCGAAKKPNVLLLTLDTTRADRLGCYGYAQATTPNLDRLVAEGVLFEEAQSVMPLTTPTHATILTGCLPIEHGVRLNSEGILPADIPTLAELFKADGYATAAFVASRVLDAKYGLNRGFDLYDCEKPSSASLYRPGKEITDSAVAWLEQALGAEHRKPFLLWAHYYDPHIPLMPHPELTGLHSQDPYDVEIAYMDRHVGRLLDFLRQRGVLDNTLVVALADHGESLGEHDELLHGHFIYQCTQHIPLIFHWAGHLPVGRHVTGTVSQTDIMPTIVELAGISPKASASANAVPPPHNPLLSHSFAAAVTGAAPLAPRVCHMETLWPYYHFGWSPLAGVVEGNWSYIHAPQSELYNLAIDGGQTNDLAVAEPRRLDELAIQLERIEKSVERHTVLLSPKQTTLSPEEFRRLASLGYLSGKSDTVQALAKEKNPANLTNPKTKSRVILAYNRQNLLLGSGPADEELLSDCLLLAAEFPDKPGYLIQAGRAYLSRGELAQAQKMLEKAVALSPTNAVARRLLEAARAERK